MDRIRVFPKIDDSGNIGNKGLHKEEQNKFSKKIPPMGIEPRTPLVAHLVLHSHAVLTELTWQVLREGCLALLLLVHQFTFALR